MCAFYSGDYIGAVVADFGAYSTKIGRAGDDGPKCYFRSSVAALREEPDSDDSDENSTNSSTANNDMEVDEPTSETVSASNNNNNSTKKDNNSIRRKRRRPIVKVNYDSYNRYCTKEDDGEYQLNSVKDSTTGLYYDPTPWSSPSNGSDWADLVPIFLKHAYTTEFGYKDNESILSKHPLLLSEPSYNPPPIRQQMLELLFEEYDLPAVFISKDSVLSCFATGRTTATVVDIGYSGTTVSPVHDGYVEVKGVRRSPIGVKEMDALLLQNMDDLYAQQLGNNSNSNNNKIKPLFQVKNPTATRRPEFYNIARLHLAGECRQIGAGAAINTTSSGTFQAPHQTFDLPDGTVLSIPSQQRFGTVEYLLGGTCSAPGSNTTVSVTLAPALASRRQQVYKDYQDRFNNDILRIAAEQPSNDAVFSDAAAVGISKRQTKQSGSTTISSASKKSTRGGSTKNKKQAERLLFDNAPLQKACHPYLQALLQDQSTDASIANMVCQAAYRCDRDQQPGLLGNVVLGGGGSCIGPTENSLPEAVKDQVEAILHVHTPGWRVKTLSPGFAERRILSWLGGSILASMGSFHEYWITKAEYEEWGPAIVNRKCP